MRMKCKNMSCSPSFITWCISGTKRKLISIVTGKLNLPFLLNFLEVTYNKSQWINYEHVTKGLKKKTKQWSSHLNILFQILCWELKNSHLISKVDDFPSLNSLYCRATVKRFIAKCPENSQVSLPDKMSSANSFSLSIFSSRVEMQNS